MIAGIEPKHDEIMKRIRKICLYFAIIAVTWLFAAMGLDHFLDKVGYRLFSIESSVANDCFVLILFVAVSFLIFKKQNNDSIEVYSSLRRNALSLVFVVIFVYACIFQRDSFARFSICNQFAYADVLMAWVTLWYLKPLIMNWISKKKGNDNGGEPNENVVVMQSKLTGDDANPVDVLERRNEAKAICDYIFHESNDFSTTIAISITGSWGAGKTVLMNYLKDCMDEKGIDHFDYSPWQRSQKDIALDFLNHLKQCLEKDNDDELHGLKAYIRSMKVSNITGWFNLGVHAFTSLFTGEDKSTSQLLDDAKAEMMTLEKPVVAFVDDVDRISRKDFLDVMRLIRATASFPKLIYIVAYDRERALKLLGKNYGEGYLSKIFNVSHSLANIGNDQLQKLALERFKDYGITDENDSPFASIDLTGHLPTIREIKRYFNLLGKDYLAQSEMRNKVYFNFDFYAKLELLKHTDLLAYMMLKNEPTAYLDVNKDDWNDTYCYKVKEKLNFQNKATEVLLREMFDTQDGVSNIFVCPGGLQLLFENDLDDSYVSRQEFEKAIQDDSLVDSVKQWIEQKKQGILFCLSNNLHLPTETIMNVFELLIVNRPSDIIHTIDLSQLEPSDENSLFGFSRIGEVDNPYWYVEDNHAFYLCLNRSLSEGEKQEPQEIEVLKQYATGTERPREMLAIVSGMMRQSTENGEVPERWLYDLVEVLFNRIASKVTEDTIKYQYYVVEALHYLPFYQATGQLLYPYLKQNPGLWLRLTLNIDDDFKVKSRVTINTKVMHSMFDTYKDYQGIMSELSNEYDDTTVEYQVIKEHQLLTERTGKIDSLGVSDFELDNYPALKGIQYQEKTTIIFVTRFYEDTKEMMQKGGCPFFNNQSGKPELFGE